MAKNKKYVANLTNTKHRNKIAYLFLTPWLIGVLFLSLIPFIMCFAFSFTTIKYTSTGYVFDFVGIKTYANVLFGNVEVIPAIGQFIKVELTYVPIVLIMAFIIATILVKDIKGKKEDEEITYKDAFNIGLFQAVALFPGISRSGATIVGGMFRNLKRETAFKFSFILYIPISFATMILGVKDLVEANISSTLAFTYFICMIISGIVTYFATKWFNGIMKKGKLIYFVLYCLIVGTLVILFL